MNSLLAAALALIPPAQAWELRLSTIEISVPPQDGQSRPVNNQEKGDLPFKKLADKMLEKEKTSKISAISAYHMGIVSKLGTEIVPANTEGFKDNDGTMVHALFVTDLSETQDPAKKTSLLLMIAYLEGNGSTEIKEKAYFLTHPGGEIAKAKKFRDGDWSDLPLDANTSKLFRHDMAYFCSKVANDLDGAISNYTVAIELDPKYVEAYSRRGDAKKAKGDFIGAMADYARAIELDPKSGSVSYRRGCLRYDSHAWAEALADFRQVVGKDADLQDYARIRIYLVRGRQGEGEAAKAVLAEYRKERPVDKAGNWEDKILAFLTGDLGEKDFLDAAPSTDLDKNCQALFYAGTKRLIGGEKPQATGLFRKCLETNQKGAFEYASAKAELEALKKE